MGSRNAKRGLACLCRAGCGALLVAAAHVAPAADLPQRRLPRPSAALAAPEREIVTLVWFDVEEQLADGFAEMAAEVRSIFAEIGLPIAWRRARPGDPYGEGAAREIAVIALSEDPSIGRRGQPILGLVVRGQQPTRAFWTFLGNIRRTLGIDAGPGPLRSPFERTQLARALARVVAHEVVHALAPDHPHDGNGLMRHALSRSQLLGPRQPLGPGCARSVLAALDRPPARVEHASGPAGPLVAIP